jgi:hypothetical protein
VVTLWIVVVVVGRPTVTIQWVAMKKKCAPTADVCVAPGATEVAAPAGRVIGVSDMAMEARTATVRMRSRPLWAPSVTRIHSPAVSVRNSCAYRAHRLFGHHSALLSQAPEDHPHQRGAAADL